MIFKSFIFSEAASKLWIVHNNPYSISQGIVSVKWVEARVNVWDAAEFGVSGSHKCVNTTVFNNGVYCFSMFVLVY